MTLQERFWAKVDKSAGPDGCWLWTASLGASGYGQFSYDGRMRRAHHVAWFLEHGEWPLRGMSVCHRCDNPICVNPAHLFVGTQADNLQDMRRKGRARPADAQPKMRGEDHPQARLTSDIVRAIRQDAASGMSSRAVGDKYGIQPRHARSIISRRLWRYLD